MSLEFKKPLKIWQWLGITLFATLLSAWLVVYFASLDMEENISGTTALLGTFNHEAKVMIDFGGGKTRAFRGSVIGGMSVYHALLAASKAGNLDVEVVSSTEGSFVKKIDSVSDNSSKEWNYYLNGFFQNKNPIDKRAVSPGDAIEFRYE